MLKSIRLRDHIQAVESAGHERVNALRNMRRRVPEFDEFVTLLMQEVMDTTTKS